MTFDDLPDDVQFAAEPKPEPKIDVNALAVRRNITQIENALSEFDKLSAGLSDLAARYPVDLVYDVTTGAGMVEAIAHRAAWREPRLSVERLRKQAKAPVLTLGKDIDARASWLTEQLVIGETPVHEQIKAEEARKEAAKQARINAEFGRIAAIQEAIGEIHLIVQMAAGKGSAAIGAATLEVQAFMMGVEVFQEFLADAKAAQSAALVKLDLMMAAALHVEVEAAKLAAERAELAELRAAQAETKRIAAEAQKAEAEKLAADKAEFARVQIAAAQVIAQQQAEIDAQKAALEAASKPAPVAIEPAPVVAVAADAPDISIIQISERLGFVVTRALIEGLGVESNQGLTGGKIKWREADFRPICAALIRHIQGVAA